MKKAGAVTVIIQPSPFTYRERPARIRDESRLQARFPPRPDALIAYGPDYADLYRGPEPPSTGS
jgi:hypothetical protein